MFGVHVCVCSYRCALLARRVSLRGSNTDGNPSYGSVTCYITSQLRPGRPLKGLPSVGVYTCMYLRMYIHGCICMRVCGCGLSKVIWITRVSRGEKKDTG